MHICKTYIYIYRHIHTHTHAHHTYIHIHIYIYIGVIQGLGYCNIRMFTGGPFARSLLTLVRSGAISAQVPSGSATFGTAEGLGLRGLVSRRKGVK